MQFALPLFLGTLSSQSGSSLPQPTIKCSFRREESSAENSSAPHPVQCSARCSFWLGLLFRFQRRVAQALDLADTTQAAGAPFLRVLCEGAGTGLPAAAKLRHSIPERN